MNKELSIASQFVPYELSLKLKNIGFDEKCFGGYIRLSNEDFELAFYKDRLINFNKESNIYVSAPLWQQAFDWFRVKGINSWITYDYPFDMEVIGSYKVSYYSEIDKSHGVLMNYSKDTSRYTGIKSFNTYHEARQACLEKLIEIVERDGSISNN